MTHVEPTTHLLTVKQAAKVFQVTEVTIRLWVRKGALPTERLGGGRKPRIRIKLDGRRWSGTIGNDRE